MNLKEIIFLRIKYFALAAYFLLTIETKSFDEDHTNSY